MRLRILATVFTSVASFVAAQSSSNTPSQTQSLSLSLTTSTATITTSTRSNNQNSQYQTTVPTTYNVTYTVTPTASVSPSASASETAQVISLDTRVDPAFGVLGAVLILTGLPSAFLGHRNRWTSFFLTGFYTLSLTCFVLILKFGIMNAVNPPSATLRGMFVLSSVVAGIAGGGIAIFFWKGARYCIGAWGGLALGFWIQCFRNGGVIRPVGFRWIMYIGCAVVGFVLCTIPKLHYHAILISTAFLGASVIILGVDCYTTAGLKEFYVWNLGFNSFFKTFTNNGIQFPVSQTMQIELGLIGAIAFIGAAVQLRILNILQHKVEEIAVEQRRRDAEADGNSTALFATVELEKAQWEREHGGKSPHARTGSDYSSLPLMKDKESSPTPTTPDFNTGGRPRLPSGISEYMNGRQSLGALPTLELGLGVEDSVPQNYISNEKPTMTRELSAGEREALKAKQDLEAEIQDIRRSIDVLKSDTSTRRPSLSSKRTLSMDANSSLQTSSHLRPPRATEPSRNRVRSMELGQLAERSTIGENMSRPSSVPLLDDSWDQYLEERKLMQPPSGVTRPITPTGLTPPIAPRGVLAPAVVAALGDRRRMESSLGVVGKEASTDSMEDIPLAKIAQPHARRRSSMGGNIPVTILPPKRASAGIVAPAPQSPMTRTFEELNDRHREKMRALQDPVTAAQKEQAALYAAKERWERNKALEREAVVRRQAEKAALLERRKRPEDEQRPGPTKPPHSRSLSADKLAALGTPGSSKKLGTSKVEDWQRYQQTAQGNQDATGSSRRRESRPIQANDAPLPDNRRRSRGPVN